MCRRPSGEVGGPPNGLAPHFPVSLAVVRAAHCRVPSEEELPAAPPPEAPLAASSCASRSGLSVASWAGSSLNPWCPPPPWKALPEFSSASRSGLSAASWAGSSLEWKPPDAPDADGAVAGGGFVVPVAAPARLGPNRARPIAPPASSDAPIVTTIFRFSVIDVASVLAVGLWRPAHADREPNVRAE